MEFPKIYQNNKVINNNQREASSQTSTPININTKISNMFNKLNQKYHKKVKIILSDNELITTVLGITNTNLVTTNSIIKITNIKDIIEL